MTCVTYRPTPGHEVRTETGVLRLVEEDEGFRGTGVDIALLSDLLVIPEGLTVVVK